MRPAVGGQSGVARPSAPASPALASTSSLGPTSATGPSGLEGRSSLVRGLTALYPRTGLGSLSHISITCLLPSFPAQLFPLWSTRYTYPGVAEPTDILGPQEEPVRCSFPIQLPSPWDTQQRGRWIVDCPPRAVLPGCPSCSGSWGLPAEVFCSYCRLRKVPLSPPSPPTPNRDPPILCRSC